MKSSLVQNHLFSFLLPSEISLTIIKSKFLANAAHFGAAIYLQTIHQVTINQTHFNSNTCRKFSAILNPTKGGALYFLMEKSKMILSQNLFIRNRADVGGAIYWKGGFTLTELNLSRSRNIFINNTGFIHGPSIASSVKYLKFNYSEPIVLTPNIKAHKYLITNMQGGYNYSECLVYLVPFDFFSQVTYSDFDEYNTIVKNFSKLKLKELDAGLYCLSGIIDRTKNLINDSIDNFKEIPIEINITEYNRKN